MRELEVNESHLNMVYDRIIWPSLIYVADPT